MNQASYVTVRLQRPHTHNGVKYPAGAQISLTPATAQWLIAQGVAVRTGSASAPTVAQPARRPACGSCGWR